MGRTACRSRGFTCKNLSWEVKPAGPEEEHLSASCLTIWISWSPNGKRLLGKRGQAKRLRSRQLPRRHGARYLLGAGFWFVSVCN